MDCRRFRELLDSYLCDELAVETNDAIMRHAEGCAACQGEMTARRELRRLLSEAWGADEMSPEGHARLRARLRREAARSETSTPAVAASARLREAARDVSSLTRFFARRRPLYLPLAATLVLALMAGGAYLYFQPQTASAAALSPKLWEEAAGDHDTCGNIWLKKQGAIKDEVDGAADYDPLLRDIHRVAAPYAQGLELRAAHVCGFGGRRFAHLAYKKDDQVFSLLVTERDREAMLKGVVPDDDGTKAGLQHASDAQGRYRVSAYQTVKHVILVVSGADGESSTDLARRIALPLGEHLRRSEQASGDH